jgi:hypothetical protein
MCLWLWYRVTFPIVISNSQCNRIYEEKVGAGFIRKSTIIENSVVSHLLHQIIAFYRAGGTRVYPIVLPTLTLTLRKKTYRSLFS